MAFFAYCIWRDLQYWQAKVSVQIPQVAGRQSIRSVAKGKKTPQKKLYLPVRCATKGYEVCRGTARLLLFRPILYSN